MGKGIGLGLGISITGGGGGAAAHIVNAVNFDGTNDYLTRGAELTGNVNGKEGIFSGWFNLQGGDGASVRAFQNGNARFLVARIASDLWIIQGRNAANDVILRQDSVNTYVAASGWHHILASWDLSVPAVWLYINDVDDAAAPTTLTDDDIDYTQTDHGIGADTGGGLKITADMAEYYFNFAMHLDLDVIANRRKFVTAGVKPVDLGSDGSTPTGTTPIMFFSGATAAWHTNKGGGGGFTENGALTDAATSPSD